MTVLSVDKKEKFFSGGSEYFAYIYYIDPDTGMVYLEHIIMDTEYIFRYSLQEDKGAWILVTDEQVSVGGNSPFADSNFEVVGFDKEKAIEFMIQKILDKPRKHIEAEVDMKKLEEELRVALIKVGIRHKLG